MNGNKLIGRTVVSALAITLLLGSVSQAQARGGWDGGGHDSDRDRREHRDQGRDYSSHGHDGSKLAVGVMKLLLGGLEYYCSVGQFYRPVAGNYVVVPAPVGAVVPAIPAYCQTVIVDGVPYYMANGVAYRQTREGYLIVQQPRMVVVQAPPVRVCRW